MKNWYVLQIYAGYEEIIKKDILQQIQERALGESFGEILIPSAKLKNMLDASQPAEQQLFPGYLLIQMELAPEAMRLVLSTPKVLRFLGGSEPVRLSQKEIDRVLSQMKGEVSLAPKKSDFAVGGEVDIAQGPFEGFVGVIEKIDDESERLTVMVSIFGRMTPIELSFDQVKR